MPAFLSRTPEDLQKIASMLLERALKNDSSEAALLALSGNLGAGKTTLTQALARELQIKDPVKSPTFLIMESYPVNYGRFHRFIHIDAYRLEHPSELGNLGFMDLLKEGGNLIVLEWPEKVLELVPESAVRVSLTFIDEKTREIIWH